MVSPGVVVRGDGVIDILLEGPFGSLKVRGSGKFRAEGGGGSCEFISCVGALLAVRGRDRSVEAVWDPFHVESL